MKLHSLKIDGYKRIQSAQLLFGDATFLIGPNNAGKSTVLKAIEWLLSAKKTIPSSEYFSVVDSETGETKPIVDTITLEAEFRNLPSEAKQWRGFKGRIFTYPVKDDLDSGLSVIYRKTFTLGKDVVVEFRSKEREIKSDFLTCKTGQDYVDKGVPSAEVIELFSDLGAKIGTGKGALEKLEQLDAIWDTKDSETWFQNPGGIPGVVLKMLPRFLLIPADTSMAEIEGGSSGVLGKTLAELFEDVRGASENYNKAQEYLNKLVAELDPEDGDSEFGKMIIELNAVLASVFPESQLHATANLSDPNTALKPTFNVEMSSNVRTAVAHQGSGMIRAAAFGMLRFRQKWLSRREDDRVRSLIVCFEEPEIYLHPSAANQMRDTIYELSGQESQIIATTHSPFIIDLSRRPRQVLNSLRFDGFDVTSSSFNVTDAYRSLEADEKSHVKMLLRVDDHVARVFFTKHVVIVEGDTEEVVIKETLKRLPVDRYLKIVSNFEIVKARGKAAIIGLVKYLVAMGIAPIVVHDRDKGIEGAEKFNQPIADALSGSGKAIQMHENIEDEMGYAAPSSEKPFRAYQETQKWGTNWSGVPGVWRAKMVEIFGEYVENIGSDT
ncbi:AAA domain protein [Burkholderia pseudomallei MSHR7527]|uniref:ATP-dependent nuclease n=2 Tax=Burkholderia pseudomallei TaxID=28450 RepID=UPI000530CC59|nr:AAA family ATPase [Burkholderia pseudomallei]KGS67084.1 AAA domain protein [Burkholderia pseudomallei MSHR7527]